MDQMMLTTIEISTDESVAKAPLPETVAAATTALRTQGCVLLLGAFSASFVAPLRDAFFERHGERLAASRQENVFEVGNRRFQVPLDISGPFNNPELYANPFALPILETAMADDIVIGSFGTVTSLPGAEEQHLHRDGGSLFNAVLDRMLPAHAISLFLPLIEFDANVGSTRLFPGTHNNMELDPATVPSFDPELPVGACVLMDHRLYHQGLANQSVKIRPLLYCVYHRPWFKDYRNQRAVPFFQISDSEYARVPQEYRKLFSWIEHYRTGLY